MYTPKLFEESRLEVMHALVQAYPFGTLIAQAADGPSIHHLPFALTVPAADAAAAPLGARLGVLRGHVARANGVWREHLAERPALVVFHGPQSYISPNWYPSKHEHGKVVPTWNYAVVHARGTPRFVEDVAWLERHLTDLTDRHEAFQDSPWRLSDAPAAFRAQMMSAIVGIEIPIESLEGKWKVSQNRPPADRAGVVAGLQRRGTPEALAMAALVSERLE